MPKSAEHCCAGSNYAVVRWIVARHIAMTSRRLSGGRHRHPPTRRVDALQVGWQPLRRHGLSARTVVRRASQWCRGRGQFWLDRLHRDRGFSRRSHRRVVADRSTEPRYLPGRLSDAAESVTGLGPHTVVDGILGALHTAGVQPANKRGKSHCDVRTPDRRQADIVVFDEYPRTGSVRTSSLSAIMPQASKLSFRFARERRSLYPPVTRA